MEQVRKVPGVVNATFIAHDMAGHNGGTSGLKWPSRDPEDRTEFENVAVSYGMPETAKFELKEGRAFSKDFGADSNAIIFNEAGIKYMGLKEPLGKTVQLWGENTADRALVS